MKLLEEFSQYIIAMGYSRSSCYQLPNCVKEFLLQTKKAVEDMNEVDIRNFYDYLQTRILKRRVGVLSESMINHYMFSLRTFFMWLEQSCQIRINPMSNLKFKRPVINSREPLSQAEVQELFLVALKLEERAILHLFYSCGLRRSEAEKLDVKDVNFGQKLLYVRSGKGSKRRVIPMNVGVVKELESYYEHRSKSAVSESFMLNKNGERMRGSSYNMKLKELLKRTNISVEISLHHLRHSIATHLLENGLSVEKIREFLGHEHLESTQIYAKVLSEQLNKL